jgi:hypothetical protein
MRLTRCWSSLALALLMLILCGCRAHTTLNMAFSGAVAFVLAAKDDAATKNTDYVTALAVRDDDAHSHLDAHLAQDVAYFRATAPVPAHYAYLRVPARNYCAPSGPCKALPEGGPTYYYFHLDGVKITIGDLATPGGRRVKLVSVDQIPRLGQISAYTYQYGTVCAECLAGAQDGYHRVAAWFRFTRGTFSRGKGAESSGLYYHDSNGHEQNAHPPRQISLSNNVTLDADFDSDIVRVDLVPLPGEASAYQSFRLRAAPGEHKVAIDLIDAPPSDILCQAEKCFGPSYSSDGQTVSHFDLFYELSKTPYAAGSYFVYPRVRAMPFLGNPYCSIVMMDP